MQQLMIVCKASYIRGPARYANVRIGRNDGMFNLRSLHFVRPCRDRTRRVKWRPRGEVHIWL